MEKQNLSCAEKPHVTQITYLPTYTDFIIAVFKHHTAINGF